MAVGLKQKEIVNNIVEKVIISLRVQFLFDLKLMYLLTHIAGGSSCQVILL